MPKIGVSKEQIEGLPELPAGRYTFMLSGFSPKLAKSKANVNLNPVLKVINHSTLNDRQIWHNCNSAFPPGMFDMAHAVGIKFENEGTDNPEFPGEFQCRVHGADCDSSDPENWQYIGPLIGQVGECELGYTDNGKGKQVVKLKKFYCKVSGCTASHKEDLT